MLVITDFCIIFKMIKYFSWALWLKRQNRRKNVENVIRKFLSCSIRSSLKQETIFCASFGSPKKDLEEERAMVRQWNINIYHISVDFRYVSAIWIHIAVIRWKECYPFILTSFVDTNHAISVLEANCPLTRHLISLFVQRL